jgi:UDP:flavonoid glycosyltransferase YjiC (YdhE family)
MVAPYSLGKGPTPEAALQQSILQQTEAVLASQSSYSIHTGTEPLPNTDLVDAAEEDVPPPAYSNTYGEIRNEKHGLGTSAQVTDDGRINIRINQLNRRLSQILSPALRQQAQNFQDTSPPPPPYIPPSLGGEEGVPPPPPLNVVIQVVGSRGDVQPFIALGKVLKDIYGHRVRLATHPNFKTFVQENGLEFFSIGGDPSLLMGFMVKNPGLMPRFRSLLSGDIGQRRRDVAEYIQGCWRSCYQAGDGMRSGATDQGDSDLSERPFVADCIIANPPSFAHIHIAEKLGVPLHIMFTMPYSPTQAFPHPLANIQSSNADPQFTNYMSYAMIELLSWQALGDIINRFRAKCLGLDPVSLTWAPGMLHRLKVPHTYCWSPALIPKPNDWGSHISISGFSFLNLASNYTPDADLQAFLDAGPPPVFIGFGSIVLDDPDAMTKLIFKAVRKAGQRVLFSKGWGCMGAGEVGIPEGVFMLGDVPHDWLFKRVSCVVHHGGAGTTAAGIMAGRPTLVVPFFGDQPFWGAMVAQAGAGPEPIPHKQLTADNLANAIKFCLKPESLERAKELANKIATEQGRDVGAQSFHQYLEVDRLRCTLAPFRAAVWRVRRTKVQLSAFAACTLANANLLDFRNLKLYRAQEYETDDGPWDPISGGFVAACEAASGMAMGIVEVPSETVKAAMLPFRSSRQHSHASSSTSRWRSENSHMEGRSTPATSLESKASYEKAAISDNNPDMMRRTSAHTSKGVGRFAKALIQSPMDLSMSFTKGFHNMPKLWGDDTVRPQARVSDFKSGVQTAGKQFGLGWYDGVTGLATLPWKGAQKDGASGFVKGIGKGMAGFITKPGAGTVGTLGYTMKGVHKEVQKLFGTNVQKYIVASRTAQGYEEWLESSDAEKEEVILRWKLIQKYMKRRHRDEMVRDILEAQQNMSTKDKAVLQTPEHISSSVYSTYTAGSSPQDAENLAMGDSGSAVHPVNTAREESLARAEIHETIRLPVQETSHRDTEEDARVERASQESIFQLQRQRRKTADDQADHESLGHAIVTSEAEAQNRAREELENEEQLKKVIAQSLGEQRRMDGDSGWEGLYHDDDEELYDPGHLAGTIQKAFGVQQQKQLGEKTTREKTTREKTEEEIVMEYVKKQSLLEQQHHSRRKGKGPADAAEDTDDEELQMALQFSMQGHGEAGYR